MRTILKTLVCVIGAFLAFSSFSGSFAEIIDKVIVVVNDEVVTQREFDRAFMPVRISYEANFKGEEFKRRLAIAREGLLEQLVNSKLAVSIAKKKDMKINEEELKKRIESVKSYYGSEEEFLQALSAKGTNLTEFKREIRDQMLAQELVDKEVAATIVIAPADIRDLYEKNKDKLVSPEQVKVRGIMVRKSDDPENEEARKKIDKIISDFDKGMDFATVATEQSEGPYAKGGGDMGYVASGQTIKEIDEVIFKLKEGERSDIVESNMGYHVFLVEEKAEARPLKLEEVSDFLKQQLFMKEFEKKLMAWLEEKRKNAYISYK
ncbi:MAG: peptidylprolyl isomerase [Candidatus Omnitrophota bacterium]|nr:peptidylprolyl isomerase [Candidatus Omnitrophota bacterium]